jgi:Rieske Fe-S protein
MNPPTPDSPLEDSTAALPPGEETSLKDESDRRRFLRATACVAIGGVAVLAPTGVGTTILLSPLRRAGRATEVIVRLTTLDSLPLGGAPQLFQVIAERTDAWTRHPRTGIGAVFLQRTGENEVRALHATCPHLGCAVEFRGAIGSFFCPCHNSSFAPDGTINDPNSPSLRAMDALEVEIRAGGEVWVKFQNFQAGKAEKVPVA